MKGASTVEKLTDKRNNSFRDLTESEFKQYMSQGLGRCALCLQNSENIEKYKDTVLYGCLHNLSYDVQAEGTRAAYVYSLTRYFDSSEYFLSAIINEFETLADTWDDEFKHFADILECFAGDGSEAAQTALDKKYYTLLNKLQNNTDTEGYDFNRDNFERLCVVELQLRGYGVKTLCKIADDIGELYAANSKYDASDFDWLYYEISSEIGEKRMRGILEKQAAKSENIRLFFEKYLESEREDAERVRRDVPLVGVDEMKSEMLDSPEIPIGYKFRFSKCATDSDNAKLVDAILTEDDPEKKAELLSVFEHKNGVVRFPIDTLIEYAESDNKNLSVTALNVMAKCRSDKIRNYALNILTDEKFKAEAIEILLANYTPDIKELLLKELYSLEVDYEDFIDWHSIGLKILSVKDMGVRLPKEFFLYVYETTLCSFCRGYAIDEMKSRRHITRDLIEECRYDSNSDISKYANRYYPRKEGVK